MKNSVKLFSAFMAITMLVASSIGHVSADSALASPSLTATSNSDPFTYLYPVSENISSTPLEELSGNHPVEFRPKRPADYLRQLSGADRRKRQEYAFGRIRILRKPASDHGGGSACLFFPLESKRPYNQVSRPCFQHVGGGHGCAGIQYRVQQRLVRSR